MSFSNDIPWVLACGGNSGEIAVWDTSENINIENHFKPYLAKGTYNPEDYDPEAVIQEEDENEDYHSMSDDDMKKKEKKGKKNKKNKKKA